MRHFRGIAIAFALAFLVVVPRAHAARGDCAQPVSEGDGPAASDCLRILQVAVGSASCSPACSCAPNGGASASASDALVCLKKAVGQAVPLACACAVMRVHYLTSGDETISFRAQRTGSPQGPLSPCTKSSSELWICNVGAVSGNWSAEPFLGNLDAKGTLWKLRVPGALEVFPFFTSNQGRVEVLQNVSSTKLGNTRDVAVYLPPSYDENTIKRYPVLFLQDGQNLFDPLTAFGGVEWMADETMDFLATQSGIEEAILVAPYSGASRIDEYTPTFDANLGSGGKGDLYLDFLLDELRPVVETQYRADKQAAPWIGGSSLGGLLALYGAWTRDSDFAGAMGMSPALYWDDAYLNTFIQNDAFDSGALRFYLDVGTGEGDAAVNLADDLDSIFVAKGFVENQDLRYVVAEGQLHNESFWAQRLPSALGFLLRDPDRLQP